MEIRIPKRALQCEEERIQRAATYSFPLFVFPRPQPLSNTQGQSIATQSTYSVRLDIL
jgi:hypothetical protein